MRIGRHGRWPSRDCGKGIRERVRLVYDGGLQTCGSGPSWRQRLTVHWGWMNEPENYQGELLTAVARVVSVFDALGIEYLIGGSVASSVFGEPRQTMDADLVACVLGRHAQPFVDALSNEFYADLGAILSAIQ